MRPIAIALTGASGMPYAITLLKELVKTQDKIYVMISQAASIVITMETDLNLGADTPSIEKNLSQYLGAKAIAIRGGHYGCQPCVLPKSNLYPRYG